MSEPESSFQPSHENFQPFYEKMASENISDIAIQNFQHYYQKLCKGETGLVFEKDIKPVDALPDMESLSFPELEETGNQHIRQAVIIKLNGGLGTSMGMQKAKSLLTIKNDLSFLDIIVRQAEHLDSPVPVIFMNSFSTRSDTLAALETYDSFAKRTLPADFLQNKVLKVNGNDLSPVDWPECRELEWCPPGHGDIYTALLTSGMLDRLLEAGYEYAFVSNSDNLGAVLDPAILGYFVKNELSFMMETADRTESDKKGGHLARLTSGRYVLREIAQCPDEDIPFFQDINRHKYFNTNNIWFHLPSLKSVLDRNKGVMELPMIRNRKTVDPRDPESTMVYQLETAMGAAIRVFDDAGAIRVSRSRFAPVKDTGDLLVVRSDCYVLNDRFQVVPNPDRKTGKIRINLDPEYYKLIDDFESRFPFGAPSLVACESLTVKGDFTFGANVILEGDVRLINNSGQAFQIKDKERIRGEFEV